jgi:pimeloyl-ACP methyl ester carboxylesterase
MTIGTALTTVDVGGRTLAYRELGDGPAVLLLHGWPTSSYLWRNVMPPIARSNRVLALDLPGFGGSDKPVDIRYDLRFFEDVIDGFLATLGVEEVAVAVHDLGGPIGVHWALDRPHRVTGLALLNTILYPEFSEAVVEFVTILGSPQRRTELTSPAGLEAIIRLGVVDGGRVTDELVDAVRAPFESDDDRTALAKAGIELGLRGLLDIEQRLPALGHVPVRIVYGEHDRVLTDVAETMRRVQADLPQAVATALPYGHFVQEDAPGEVGEILAQFFAELPSDR